MYMYIDKVQSETFREIQDTVDGWGLVTNYMEGATKWENRGSETG